MDFTFPMAGCKDLPINPMRIIFTLSCSFLLAFSCHSQVDTGFELQHNLFLSAYRENKTQWVCGMEVSALDSTNRKLKVKLNLLKNWKKYDSLDLIVLLDTTQTYLQHSEKIAYQAMKYTSAKEGISIFIAVPDKHEYTLSNGMSGVSWQFHYAHADLPKKWKKHQKHFEVFYEK
jgi:hypothetical protein